MSDYLMRAEPDTTLAQLRASFDADVQTEMVMAEAIEIDATEDLVVRFPTFGGTKYEVPLTPVSLEHLADWVKVPHPFMKRVDRDVQQYLLTTLLARQPGEVLVGFNPDTGIQAMRGPGQHYVDPRRVVDVATSVLGEDATVIDGWRSPKEYRFDVVVSPESSFAIGGDLQVGDITRGGLRFGQDTQHNLAPWVEPFLYRLQCTNGIEVADHVKAFDLRKAETTDEIIDALELAAHQAFGDIEHKINSFYDLRNRHVGDANQMLLRIGQEQGVAPKVLHETIQRLPAMVEDTSNASLFEIVNALTNAANEESIIDRPNVRRKIERAGGEVINDHARRCPRCQSSLVGHALTEGDLQSEE